MASSPVGKSSLDIPLRYSTGISESILAALLMNFASILLLKRSSPRLASTLSSNYGRRIEIGPAPVRIVRSGSHPFLTTLWCLFPSFGSWYFAQCSSYFCFKFNLLHFPCSFPVQALPVPLRYLALFVWKLLLYFSPRTFLLIGLLHHNNLSKMNAPVFSHPHLLNIPSQ